MKNKNNNIHSRMLIGRTGVIPLESPRQDVGGFLIVLIFSSIFLQKPKSRSDINEPLICFNTLEEAREYKSNWSVRMTIPT